MSILRRYRVVLGLDRNKIGEVITGARTVYDGMKADPETFNAPTPALPVLLIQTQELDVAQQATTTKAKGTVATRDLKRDALWTSLECERMFTQTLVDANPELAAKIAASVGMTLAATPARIKPILAARQAMESGPVTLFANARALSNGKRCRPTFHWQASGDGGKTWRDALSTPVADTEIPDLTPGTYAFRVRVTIGRVTGEWCPPVTFQVR